ncbi:hypothetical protein N7537_008500 [Penicillium hordei]|uniref:Uncharacterized protein n=1 Tax=Penicillium hordei TaxID=40994 RepID=A0AAD6H0F9_9EURO|nr:uncharacterized protein N7537_008500 [Penicillium hordei]KAJ5598416.1 hypothetical protein N7537_008500 [Penicillium hordei]
MVATQQSIEILGTPITTYSTSSAINRFGTLAYHDLTVYGQDMGVANIFLALSSADLHWDDFMRHLPNYHAGFSEVVVICQRIPWDVHFQTSILRAMYLQDIKTIIVHTDYCGLLSGT